MSSYQSSVATSRRAYRINEFAVVFGISRATTYRLIAAGKLRTIKVAGCRLIPVEAAEQLAQSGC